MTKKWTWTVEMCMVQCKKEKKRGLIKKQKMTECFKKRHKGHMRKELQRMRQMMQMWKWKQW